MEGDTGLQLDDTAGDLDQPETEGVELRAAPLRLLRQGRPQRPHEPVGAAVQEEAELIGGGLRAGGAVGCEVGLPGLDVVLGLAAPAVDLLVKVLASRSVT